MMFVFSFVSPNSPIRKDDNLAESDPLMAKTMKMITN